MKKLLFVLLLGVVWVGTSEAAGPTRGAKPSFSLNYTASVSSPTAQSGPVVIYSVLMSTGATGDYVALFDTNTVTGVTAVIVGNTLKTRCTASSTIAWTQCNYDPPLQFNLGVAAIQSSAANQALIVYEKGRVINGY